LFTDYIFWHTNTNLKTIEPIISNSASPKKLYLKVLNIQQYAAPQQHFFSNKMLNELCEKLLGKFGNILFLHTSFQNTFLLQSTAGMCTIDCSYNYNLHYLIG